MNCQRCVLSLLRRGSLQSNQASRFSSLLLLILIAIVGVFTLDVYLPGIPAMANQFGVSIREVTYTFTAFSLVFAITQLFHGSFSDLFGRKPILIVGLSFAALATFICIYAQSYEILFLARILQAVGISAFVVVNAIIRDLYTGAKAVQVRTLVATASGISISIAPTVGGALQGRFGWQGGFIASLILITAALLYVVVFFRESNLKKSNSHSFTTLAMSYRTLFQSEGYLSHVIMAMLAYTVHFTFIIMSATIFIQLLGATPIIFGYLMITYGVVYFLGGLFAGWIAKKLTILRLIQLGSYLIGIGGLMMLISFATLYHGASQALVPMAIITVGVTLVRAAAITGALAPIPTQAGQGSAGLNLVQFSVSALIATGISNFDDKPQLSIALLAVTCAILIGYLRRKIA